MRLFADNIFMFGTVSNLLDMSRFQTDLNIISLWAFNSKMKFNVSAKLSRLELKTRPYTCLITPLLKQQTHFDISLCVAQFLRMLPRSGIGI